MVRGSYFQVVQPATKPAFSAWVHSAGHAMLPVLSTLFQLSSSSWTEKVGLLWTHNTLRAKLNLAGFICSEVCLFPWPTSGISSRHAHSQNRLQPKSCAKMYCCDPNNWSRTVNIYLEKRTLKETGCWKLMEILAVVNFQKDIA